MNLLPKKQLLPYVPFQSTKYREKDLCVDNIQTIGDVCCPTCRNEKCVYVSTNKTTKFYDCKKCKASCHVVIFPFKEKNQQLCCLAGTVHIVLQERRVATTKKKPSPFLKKFLRQSQLSTSELEPKKDKSSPNIE